MNRSEVNFTEEAKRKEGLLAIQNSKMPYQITKLVLVENISTKPTEKESQQFFHISNGRSKKKREGNYMEIRERICRKNPHLGRTARSQRQSIFHLETSEKKRSVCSPAGGDATSGR